MDFPFVLSLLASLSLAYIIHFQKVALPSKAKLIDGADSTLMYVDANNTILRMGFTGTALT